MAPGSSEAGRRILMRRLYMKYAEDRAFMRVRSEADGVMVPGDGPIRPRLMFVGEAPGAREAKLRRPFVGASGELLGDMLKSVFIARSEVFVTNVVKYRPLGNRDPSEEEVYAGLPYLRREHRILGRPPMVLLGKHAKNTLGGALNGWPVGKWFWMEADGGFPVLPLHHPAYGIYQRSHRPMMFQQFRAVLEPPSRKEEVDAAI